MRVQIKSIPTGNSVDKLLKWMEAQARISLSQEVDFIFHREKFGISKKAIHTPANGADGEIFDIDDRLSLVPILKDQFLFGAFTNDLKIEFWFYPFFAPGYPEYEEFIARMNAGF
jgi:hypothetical protein